MLVSSVVRARALFSGDKLQSYLQSNSEDKYQFGVEVEVEGMSGDIIPPVGWIGVNDGSLRNGGVEFIFRNPTGYGNAIKRLKALESYFESMPYRPVLSDRTSVHVHTDVSMLDIEHLKKIIFCYVILERLIFRVFAEKRYGNIFCLPLSHCARELQFLGRLMNPSDEFNIADAFHAFNSEREVKYCALNLNPIWTKGSIEFRHLAGNYKFDTIGPWVKFIKTLVHKSKDFDSLYHILDDVSAYGAVAFAARFFDSKSLSTLSREVVELLISEGVKDANELTMTPVRLRYPPEVISKYRKTRQELF